MHSAGLYTQPNKQHYRPLVFHRPTPLPRGMENCLKQEEWVAITYLPSAGRSVDENEGRRSAATPTSPKGSINRPGVLEFEARKVFSSPTKKPVSHPNRFSFRPAEIGMVPVIHISLSDSCQLLQHPAARQQDGPRRQMGL